MSTPAITGRLVSIGGINQVIPMIDDNDLVAGSLDKKCVGDLITHGDLVYVVAYEDSTAGDLDTHDVGDVVSTLTLTFSSLDTITCSAGYISERDISAFENNTRGLVTYTFTPIAAYVYNVVA